MQELPANILPKLHDPAEVNRVEYNETALELEPGEAVDDSEEDEECGEGHVLSDEQVGTKL